ncbi:hypothetical protein F4678DRAFT_413627 [Xylaria arbuscula]|nr:hypothetical protein F4678DRAFT_413627 [Xylaria arbuscula]
MVSTPLRTAVYKVCLPLELLSFFFLAVIIVKVSTSQFFFDFRVPEAIIALSSTSPHHKVPSCSKMAKDFNYNLFQQIYCLSMVTGIVGKVEGPEADLQAQMKQKLSELLPSLTGSWSITWGPRVYQVENPESDKGGPDNVWFAAVDDTQKVCVVAIAGTASNSDADIHQDVDVAEVVDFNAWIKLWSPQDIPKPTVSSLNENSDFTIPYCAKGNCDGVWNILKSVSTEPKEGTRIDEYLRGLDPSYTVVFTGHSLGGALSPLIALGLTQAKLLGDNVIKVLPSAGPTPGNEVLAANYATAFPRDVQGTEYRVYNTDYYNEFDIVPQAWSVVSTDDRNLGNILSKILHPTTQFEVLADLVWSKVAEQSINSKIRYTPLQGDHFTGPPPPASVDSFEDVGNYSSIGHVFAYWDKIGIREFTDLFEEKFRKSVGARDDLAI